MKIVAALMFCVVLALPSVLRIASFILRIALIKQSGIKLYNYYSK